MVISPLIALASEQAAKLNASNMGAVPLWGETSEPLAYLVGGHGGKDFMGVLDGADPVTTRQALAMALADGSAVPIRDGTDEQALLLRARMLQSDGSPATAFLFASPEKLVLSLAFRSLLAQLHATHADDGRALLRGVLARRQVQHATVTASGMARRRRRCPMNLVMRSRPGGTTTMVSDGDDSALKTLRIV